MEPEHPETVFRRRGRDSRRHARPGALGELLARIAAHAPRGFLRNAEAASRLRSVVGPWLSRHVADVRVAGTAWQVTLTSPEAARELRALSPEVVARLRAKGGLAPATLGIVTREILTQREFPAPPVALEPASERQPGPLSQAALARVADPLLRARLGRLAASWRLPDA